LLPFSLLILSPKVLRCGDVELLAFLGSSSEQDDKHFAILAEVNAVTGSEVHTQLQHTPAYGLCDSSALLHPREEGVNSGLGDVVQLQEPTLEWFDPLLVGVLPEFDHVAMVAQKLPYQMTSKLIYDIACLEPMTKPDANRSVLDWGWLVNGGMERGMTWVSCGLGCGFVGVWGRIGECAVHGSAG
jgi:hypothetical protein